MTEQIEAAIAVTTPTPSTCKVRIDAGGREVELETTHPEAQVDALATTALALWRATAGDNDPEARSLFGLVTSERAADRSTSSTLDEPIDAPH